MKNFALTVLLFLSAAFSTFCFAQKKIVILGSSTAAGASATSLDSSWAGRLQAFYRQNNTPGDYDTVITNLSVYGYSTWQVLPTDKIPPPGRPYADTLHNITKALTLSPDLVIINLPSNDVAGFDYAGKIPLYTINETINNFRLLYKTITSKGIRCFITTAQPRNDLDDRQRKDLSNLKDSIMGIFGLNSIDFWSDLVADSSFHLKDRVRHIGFNDSLYHLNNYGHYLLSKRVIAKHLFPAPNFSAYKIHFEAENYASMFGVVNESTSDAGGGSDVGYIDPNDWMDYKFNLPSEGTYTINFRIASFSANASFELRKSDGSVLTTIKVPNTGGWQIWQTITTTVHLTQGPQTLRVISTSPQWNNWNFNWMEFSLNKPVTISPLPSSTDSIQHIEAEKWTDMNGVNTEVTTDTSGVLDVDYIDPNDWMDYTISIPSTGIYTLRFRVATPASLAQFQLKVNDSILLATVKVPNTGGYQNWQTISTTTSLSKGLQKIRLLSTSSQWNNWNINWLEIVTGGTLSVKSVQARDDASVNFHVQLTKGKVIMDWHTDHEFPSTYYDIQRSSNGKDFESIGLQNGKGSDIRADYTWTDQYPLTGRNIYRLKVNSVNSTGYSDTISISTLKSQLSISKLYTTPSSLTAEINSSKNQFALISIVTIMGEVVRKETHSLLTPVTKIDIPIANLPLGRYVLLVSVPNGFVSESFNKQ